FGGRIGIVRAIGCKARQGSTHAFPSSHATGNPTFSAVRDEIRHRDYADQYAYAHGDDEDAQTCSASSPPCSRARERLRLDIGTGSYLRCGVHSASLQGDYHQTTPASHTATLKGRTH